MKTTIHLILVLALFTMLMAMVNIYQLGKQSAEASCLFNAANKHAYITRKMCDPNRPACVIDEATQAEINDWYEEEQANCTK